jgi:hypothetical protein
MTDCSSLPPTPSSESSSISHVSNMLWQQVGAGCSHEQNSVFLKNQATCARAYVAPPSSQHLYLPPAQPPTGGGGQQNSPVYSRLCLLHVCEDAPPHVAVEHDAQVVLALQVAAKTLKPWPVTQTNRNNTG